MSPQNPTIKLPAERIAQLKAIATALDLPSVADAVGHLIRNEIKKGTIPDAIPDIAVKAYRGKVSIAFDDGLPVLISKQAAGKLAETIEGAVSGGPSQANLDYDFAVLRQGNGIRIRVPFGTDGKMLSRDLARDLARILKRFTA